MSSRFSRDDRDARDSRYPPRDRSSPPPPPLPPPARYPDRRPSQAPFGSSYSPRNNEYGVSSGRDPIPRGPRGIVDSRLPATPGPRGRGYGARAEFRDFRDAPFGGDRPIDRWRDTDHDRWDRRPSPRDREDSRGRALKDIDTDTAQRNSRDGPLSAGSNLSEPLRTAGPLRGGYGRGRGRSDWDYRASTRPFADERDSFRPRSRSRGPRRERDRSVDSRDFDRRDDFRDRRDDDRRPFRERDDSYFTREQPLRTDFRPPFESRIGSTSNSVPPTPQSERPPISKALAPERVSTGDLRREIDPARRASAVSDQGPQSQGRREMVKPEILTASRDRFFPRASSPPPSAPQVPAFGTASLTASFTKTSNVWRNPQLQKTSPAPTSSIPQVPKAPPTAPKAQLAASPPTAPKANRWLDKTKSDVSERNDDVAKDIQPKDVPLVAKQPVLQHVPVTEPSGKADDTSGQPIAQPLFDAPSQLPARPFSLPSAPPSAPRAMTGSIQPIFTKPPPSGPSDLSPVLSAPSGPRAAPNLSVSPKALPNNVPTAPRADRMILQPPRATVNTPRPPSMTRQLNNVASLHWKANGLPFNARPPIIPVKRDSSGEDKERLSQVVPSAPKAQNDLDKGRERKFARMELTVEPEPAILKDGRPVEPTEHLDHVQASPPSSDAEIVRTPPPTAETQAKPIASPESCSDDEGAFDEADIAKHEEKYRDKKSRLEAKTADLSAHEYRSTSPLLQLSLLAALRQVVSQIDFKRLDRSKAVPVSASKPAPADHLMQGDRSTTLIGISPPSEPDQSDTEMAEYESSSEESRSPFSSPEPQLSARGPPTPLSNSEQHYAARYESLNILVKDKVVDMHEKEMDLQNSLVDDYVEKYRAWRRATRAIDKERQEAEAQTKEQSPKLDNVLIGPESPPIPLPTPNEGRRAHKFSSEYEYQRVIEESKKAEEERRLKAEREQREANMSEEREATIPDMLSIEEIKRRKCHDLNRARPAAHAIRIFEFAPPRDTFTAEEDELLRKLYDKNSKAWGKIADAMRVAINSTRTYKECINHYYATKWERPYKKPTTGRKTRMIKGRRPGKGKVLQTFTNADADGEMVEGDVMQVTDTGRPRRAAAPKFGEKEAELDANGLSAASSRIMSTATTVENGESVGRTKRQKGVKEKGPKKTRAQPLAARPAVSPTKLDKDKRDKAPTTETEPWPSLGSLRGGDTTGMPSVIPPPGPYFNGNPPIYQEPADLQPSAAAPLPTERPRSYSNQQRGAASSYWSVPEEAQFRRCLAYFGTDFQAIAHNMQSKTAVMIKNHYAKYTMENKHKDIIEASIEADRRRERGETLGAPPPPMSNQRRQREPQQPAPPRQLAPNTEAIELEKSPALKPAVPSHPSPPTIPLQPRYPPMPKYSSTPPSASITTSAQPSVPTTSHIQPARSSPAPQQSRHPPDGPRLGYFFEQRPPSAHRPPLGREQPPVDHTAIRGEQGGGKDHIKSEPGSSHLYTQDLPQRLLRPPQTQDGLFQLHSSSPYQNPGTASPMHTHARDPPDRFTVEKRPNPPYGASSRPNMSQVPEVLRQPTQPVSTLSTQPVKEPSRRLNIMSMLNPEPDEDRPRRKESDHATAPAISAHQQRPPSRPYSRSSMTYPPPGSTRSAPAPEASQRDSLTYTGHRESWPGHPPFSSQPKTQHPGHRSSPHPQQPQPSQMPDFGGSLHGGDYRTGHEMLPQVMHPSVSSTPPPGTSYHSRTSSLVQPQQPVQQAGQLHANPFSQVPPTNATTGAPQQRPPDLPQALQRNDSSHAHPHYSNIHAPPPQDRQRDPHFDRLSRRDRPQDPLEQDPQFRAATSRVHARSQMRDAELYMDQPQQMRQSQNQGPPPLKYSSASPVHGEQQQRFGAALARDGPNRLTSGAGAQQGFASAGPPPPPTSAPRLAEERRMVQEGRDRGFSASGSALGQVRERD